MKSTIQQKINNKHLANRKLVAKWMQADDDDDVDKYLEYTYYIAMNIRIIKWLKRLQKMQKFWEKISEKLKEI